MIPGRVARVLDMPIMTLAYCGAMSNLLTLKPDQASPPKPMAIVRQVTAAAAECEKAMAAMNTV